MSTSAVEQGHLLHRRSSLTASMSAAQHAEVDIGINESQWTVAVTHPAGAKFVSLRSVVTDPDGDEQRQTVVRAYALR